MRPSALTDEQVAEVKRLYQQQGGVYGTVSRLARQFGVTRPTILKALDSYVTQDDLKLSKNPPQNPRSETSDTGGPVLTGPEGLIDSSNGFSCDTCLADKTLWPDQDSHTEWCPERTAA